MKISLSNDTNIDLEELIVSRMLIQANSGGGKSWAIRRIIEQAFGKVQIIVIDPEGEFNNLRQKHDFVYIAKDGDAPATVRSAALLAQRLMETKASAIIDLYEIPLERKAYVKAFLDSLVNLPKELWQDCLIIIDECHQFAPEKDESVAGASVINLASLGRKRGYCLIAASGRPAKLSKDVAAECNNKLVGRAVQDVDRKRNADEIGLTSKEEILGLRRLAPGSFYAFGPAISRDVKIVQVGDVRIKPPKRGEAKRLPPAPSADVRKILAKLKDLPQEAEQEAKTMGELRQALTIEKRKVSDLERKPRTISVQGPIMKGLTDKEVDARIRSVLSKRDAEWRSVLQPWVSLAMERVQLESKAAKLISWPEGRAYPREKPEFSLEETKSISARAEDGMSTGVKPELFVGDQKIGKGEILVLKAIAQSPDGITRAHITLVTGYKRSTRDRYLQYASAHGFVRESGEYLYITDEGMSALGSDFEPLPTGAALRRHLLDTLPEGEAKILRFLVEAGTPTSMTRETIGELTGYQRSTRDRYIQYLLARHLVKTDKFGVWPDPKLFE